jgi:hypothetical protein
MDSANKVRHIWNQQDRDRLLEIMDKWLENRLADDDKFDIALYEDRIKHAFRPIQEDLIQLALPISRTQRAS